MNLANAWTHYTNTVPTATPAGWSDYADSGPAPLATSHDALESFAHHRPHEAAETDRLNVEQTRRTFSADAANLADRHTVNARSRDARRNDWLGEAIPATRSRKVVGNGITPRSNARTPGGNRLDTVAQAQDFWFRHWANDPNAVDAEGRKTLRAMARLVVEERVTAGGAFLVAGYRRRRQHVGLVFQMFEPEQLADEPECDPADGNTVRAGVEIDRFGRPVAYWVHLSDHPHDIAAFPFHRRADRKPTRIPARRVLHYQRQRRVRETLALPDLACILRLHWDFRGYNRNEVAAKAIEAHLAYAITQNPAYGTIAEPGGNEGLDGVDQQLAAAAPDSGKTRALRFEPGMVPVLNPGEDLKLFDPTRPGESYDPFIQRNVGFFAAAQGWGYPTLSRDYRAASYASLRMNQIDDWEVVDDEQADLIDFVYRPIWQRFHDLAVAERRYAAPDGYLTDPATRLRCLECDWGFPPRRQIDLAKHAAGIKILRSLDLYNDADHAGERNENWRDNLRETAEIRAFRESIGLAPEPVGVQSNQAGHGSGTPAGGGDPARQSGQDATRTPAAPPTDPDLALALEAAADSPADLAHLRALISDYAAGLPDVD
ncbi:MAG: phage portal protein [Planctomycetota bacterium]